MSEVMGAVLLTFVALVLPLWLILHYASRWRQTRGLSAEDERMLQDLWENAERMAERINTLEEILDRDTPEWRRRQQ